MKVNFDSDIAPFGPMTCTCNALLSWSLFCTSGLSRSTRLRLLTIVLTLASPDFRLCNFPPPPALEFDTSG